MNVSNFGGFGFKKIWGGGNQSFGFRRVNAGFQQKKLYANQLSYKNQFRRSLRNQILGGIQALSNNLTLALGGGPQGIDVTLMRIRMLQAAYLERNPDQAGRLRSQIDEAQGQQGEPDTTSVFRSASRGQTIDETA